MASAEQLKNTAQSIRRAASTDPTFKPLSLEMRRLADKIEKLTPIKPLKFGEDKTG